MAPGSLLSELISLLGRDTAILLCQTVGGVSYYIPQKAHENHPFVPIIGLKGMEVLSARYGGIRITLPKAESVSKRRTVTLLNEQGLSAKKIALHAGVTERFVYKVRSDLRQQKKEKLPLFS